MSGAATAVAIGVGVGAAVGGISSAISGGDIGMGILGGAVGGAVTGGIGGGLGGALGGELAGTMTGVGVGALSGAAGGVVNSAITGGDPLMGALTGGAGGGFAGYNGAFDTGAGGFGENTDFSGSAPDAGGSGADLSSQGAAMDGGGGPGIDPSSVSMPGEPQGALTSLAESSGSPMPDLPSSGGVEMSPLGASSDTNVNMSGAPMNPNTWVNLTDPAPMSQDYLKALGVGGRMDDTGVIFDMARADQMAQQAANPSFMDSPLGWAKSQTTDFLNKPFAEQLKLGAMGVGGLSLVGSLMGGSSSGQSSPAQVQATPSKYQNAPLPTYGYAGATPGSRTRNQYTGDMTKYGYGPSFNFFDPRQMVQMAEGGSVHGPGGPKDDMIHAKLSDGEFVIPTDVVNALGNGNNDRGAGALHQMMTTARKGKRSRRAA